jgi:hypothetical protein
VYTESLFFALAVWTFYFVRKKDWILAGILAGVCSATRLIGFALLPAIIIEVWLTVRNKEAGGLGLLKKVGYDKLFSILIAPAGLLIYLIYLKIQTGDPLEFLHSIGIFGQQRSSSLVILPQVFYRYIFKVFPSLNYNYFPVVFSTSLELITALGFLILSFLSFFKMRVSYATFLAFGYIIPTLSGSFSSLPRYVIVLFPAFILAASYLINLKHSVQFIIFTLLFICLGIATSLFLRGYWIS